MPIPTQTIATHLPDLSPYESLYKTLHANPELSTLEHETHDRITTWLAEHAPHFKVTPHIAKTGLIAVLRNGAGPTLMLRADTDALPVLETTGLPYASSKRMKDVDGVEKPVMHACGHDMHITSLLCCAQLLASARDTWSGTLILIFQPAEEKGAGAGLMIDDGLFDETRHACPVPDLVVGAHVMPMPSGMLGARPGVMASYADSLKITIFGKGGHASQPQRSIDPVVVASFIVVRLQTLVAREVDPQEAAVVSVASLQAGEAENVIPEHAVLKVNVRTFSDESRDHVLSGIKRIVKAECEASECPKEAVYETISSYPILLNDEAATGKLVEGMKAHFGERKWEHDARLAGSEDFGNLATAVGKPNVYFAYGGVEEKEWERTKGKVPGNHSSLFAPCIQPTLKTAVEGYAVAALTWLGKREGTA